jgi:nitroreductase
MAFAKLPFFHNFEFLNKKYMNTLECIRTRRSIRKYQNKQISNDQIRILLEAGMYAPTARNLRGWHFAVITKPQLLKELSEVHPHGKMLAEAAAAILVCGDLTIEPDESYNAINCSAATQNILLATHELGLGAVWLGVYPRKERMIGIARTLSLKENLLPMALISIGYPDETKETPARFEEEKVSYFNQ